MIWLTCWTEQMWLLALCASVLVTASAIFLGKES